jgi:hypothetical protein
MAGLGAVSVVTALAFAVVTRNGRDATAADLEPAAAMPASPARPNEEPAPESRPVDVPSPPATQVVSTASARAPEVAAREAPPPPRQPPLPSRTIPARVEPSAPPPVEPAPAAAASVDDDAWNPATFGGRR